MKDKPDNRSENLLVRHLQRARRTILAADLLRGLFRWTGGMLLFWGGLAAADVLLVFPMEFRLPITIGAAVITLFAFLKALPRTLMDFRNLDRTALALERRFDIPRNLLINAFQLSRQSLSREEEILARQTIRHGRWRSAGIAPRELWKTRSLLKAAGLVLAAASVWVMAGFLYPSHLRLSLNRIWFPLADLPPAGKVILGVMPDRDVTVLEGDSHQVMLSVKTRGRGRGFGMNGAAPPRIVVADTLNVGVARGAMEEGQDMLPAETGAPGTPAISDALLYTHSFSDMRRSQSFRIFHDAGGTYTRSYQVHVQRAPEIVESEFRLTPPEYTGLPRSELPGPPRPVMGLPESELNIVVRLDRPVDNLYWESGGTPIAFNGHNGTDWLADTTILDAGSYTVFTVLDDDDRRLMIAAGSLLVARDQPPRVTFAAERLNREAWPGETVEFEIQAADDHGLSDVTLSVTPAHAFGRDEAREIATWTFDGPPGESRPEPLRFSLALNPRDFSPGDDYLFQAHARDFHPGRQTGTSRPLLIRVRGMEEVPSEFPVSSALDALRQAIVWQRRAFSDTRTVADYMDSVLGRDPERPEFSFHHHRQAMETRQERVDDLLGIVIERAVDKTLPHIRDVEEVLQQDVQPLVADIRRLAGAPDPWFDARAKPVEAGTWQSEFPAQNSRFVGIAWPGGNDAIALAMLDFVDADGHIIPPRYVDRYHFSPLFHPWDGPVGFVDCDAAELQKITETALETPLRGEGGPLMNWQGRVEGAPSRRVALYGVRRIRGDVERQVVMWTGGSDSLRVWFNGEPVVNRLARRAPAPDQERTVLDIAPGEHRLLVEVSVDRRAPVMALRFSETDGTPLALHADGRLLKAIEPEVVYAGGAPGHAGLVFDRDPRTAWQVEGKRPRLFICDLGHSRELSGVVIHPARGQERTDAGPYRLYLAESLHIDTSLPPVIDDVAARQSAIIDRLAAIRAAWLEEDAGVRVAEPERELPDEPDLPALAVAGKWNELVAELLDTGADSIEQSRQRRSVLDRFGDDFSDDALARLQAIKDRETRLAHYLRDIVQDMSVLGDLDLPDATQVANYQELVELGEQLADVAAEKVNQPITQITDSLDTAELELHEELQKQSEMTFGDTSRLQDVQELGEDMKTPLPMAELPQTLSDLVGEMEEGLLEFEDEAQTVGSMLKSLDAEGPIGPGRMSSTSAEGKTGDEPPDAARELEGRSGFGRTGRASGEGVTDVAEELPQDSAAAPPRDTGTPLDAGMVEDRSTEAAAESTGLGKETDDTESFGMGGSQLPPGILDRLRQTAGEQEDLRETIGRMILELRRYNLPSVKLSRAARAMDSIPETARTGDLEGFLYAYRDSLEHLYDAEEDIGRHVGVRYLLEGRETAAGATRSFTPTEIPENYRDVVAEYFKALAEMEER